MHVLSADLLGEVLVLQYRGLRHSSVTRARSLLEQIQNREIDSISRIMFPQMLIRGQLVAIAAEKHLVNKVINNTPSL